MRKNKWFLFGPGLVASVALAFSSCQAPSGDESSFSNTDQFPDQLHLNDLSSGDDAWAAVVHQQDGRIITGGWAKNPVSAWYDGDFVVARFLADSSLDSSFGSSGVVQTSIGIAQDAVSTLAIQSDGKILAAGTTNNSTSYATANALSQNNTDIALVRYTSSGSVDASFGAGGVVIYDSGGVGIRYRELGSRSIRRENPRRRSVGRGESHVFSRASVSLERFVGRVLRFGRRRS